MCIFVATPFERYIRPAIVSVASWEMDIQRLLAIVCKHYIRMFQWSNCTSSTEDLLLDSLYRLKVFWWLEKLQKWDVRIYPNQQVWLAIPKCLPFSISWFVLSTMLLAVDFQLYYPRNGLRTQDNLFEGKLVQGEKHRKSSMFGGTRTSTRFSVHVPDSTNPLILAKKKTKLSNFDVRPLIVCLIWGFPEIGVPLNHPFQ